MQIHNSMPFARLDGVKQLETVYAGFWLGAGNITRRAHSIGTAYLAGKIGKTLRLPGEAVSELRIAGLLHDVGHPAFSHALEPFVVREFGIDHEGMSNVLLRKYGIDRLLEANGFSYDRILSYINGQGIGVIITDWADRMDYLQRDSHHADVDRAVKNRIRYDLNKLQSLLRLREGQVCVKEEGIPYIEGYVDHRNYMFSEIYFFSSSMIAREMLRRGVEKAITQGVITRDDLYSIDEFLLQKMVSAGIFEALALDMRMVHIHSEYVVSVSFDALSMEGRAKVCDQNFLDAIRASICEIAEPERVFVMVTPRFEKPLRIKLLLDNGMIEDRSFLRTMPPGYRRFYVATYELSAAQNEEIKRITNSAIKTYLL
jgi:HD superfamily phosphohydrolase